MKELSFRIDSHLKKNLQKNQHSTKYFYLKKDDNLRFLEYPPQLHVDRWQKYIYHIFTTLYLNDSNKINYSYIYKKEDENTFSKMIKKYSTNKYISSNDSNFKILSKKIAYLLSTFFVFNDKEMNKEQYILKKTQYFKEPKFVILHNDYEVDFVKEKWNKKVEVILLSSFLK